MKPTPLQKERNLANTRRRKESLKQGLTEYAGWYSHKLGEFKITRYEPQKGHIVTPYGRIWEILKKRSDGFDCILSDGTEPSVTLINVLLYRVQYPKEDAWQTNRHKKYVTH